MYNDNLQCQFSVVAITRLNKSNFFDITVLNVCKMPVTINTCSTFIYQTIPYCTTTFQARLLSFVVHLAGESAAWQFDDLSRCPDAAFHTLRELPFRNEPGQETAHEGVSGAVSVHDLSVGHRDHGELQPLSVHDRHYRPRALRDDDHPLPLRILLGKRRHGEGDLWDGGHAQLLHCCEGCSLRLVAKQNIDEGEGRHHRPGEELAKERRGQVHAEGFLVFAGQLSHGLDGLGANC